MNSASHQALSEEVSLSDVREYLSSLDLSSRVMEELFADKLERGVLSCRDNDQIRVDIEALATARARVLSDIADYPLRRSLLEVSGGVLAQENLVLQIASYASAEEKEIVSELAQRLQAIREKHPELPGGAAEKLMLELEELGCGEAVSEEKK